MRKTYKYSNIDLKDMLITDDGDGDGDGGGEEDGDGDDDGERKGNFC